MRGRCPLRHDSYEHRAPLIYLVHGYWFTVEARRSKCRDFTIRSISIRSISRARKVSLSFSFLSSNTHAHRLRTIVTVNYQSPITGTRTEKRKDGTHHDPHRAEIIHVLGNWVILASSTYRGAFRGVRNGTPRASGKFNVPRRI